MEAVIAPARVADLDLAFARSRRRAAARRTRALAERRAAAVRRALRVFVVVVVAAFSFGGQATQVETAPSRAATPPRWPAFSAAACGIPEAFAGAFRSASRETHLSLALLAAVGWEESRMNPDVVSPAGARGLLQLMPGTARIVAVTDDRPEANVLAGARYLRRLVDRFKGDLALALAAYNAGPTAVSDAGAAPSIETLRYALDVEARAQSLTRCV